MLAVRVPVPLSICLSDVPRLNYCFQMITLVNFNGFSPNLVCALILWRSGFRVLMGKCRQFLTVLFAQDLSNFSYLDDNLSKYQWIFTKLGLYIDIVEIWFGTANGQISLTFDSYLPRHHHILTS